MAIGPFPKKIRTDSLTSVPPYCIGQLIWSSHKKICVFFYWSVIPSKRQKPKYLAETDSETKTADLAIFEHDNRMAAYSNLYKLINTY